MNPSSSGHIRRLTLRDFRGWRGEHSIDLNGDVVLITAPNGRGKSSVIEALARVLNRDPLHADESNVALGADAGWKLAIETADGTQSSCEWDRQRVDDQSERERLGSKWADVPETSVLRRATLFLQDRIDEQFERGGDHTLLTFLAPYPKWLDDYETRLKAHWNVWEAQKPREPAVSDIESARRRRDQAILDFVEAAAALSGLPVTRSESAAEELALLVSAATERPMEAVRWGEPEDSWSDLRAWLKRWRRGAEDPRTLEASLRLERMQAELAAYDETWPGLSQLVDWARGVVDLDRVLELVTGLARRPTEWADPSGVQERLQQLPPESRALVPLPDEALTELAEELSRVDRARAGRYFYILESWKRFWDERERERRDLEQKVEDAESELTRLQAGQQAAGALRALERLETAQAAFRVAKQRSKDAARQRENWERLRPVREAVRNQLELLDDLRRGQLDETVRERVGRAMNAVMNHFVIAGLEGPDAVSTNVGNGRAIQLGLADGRSVDNQASTGQRAQLALAWLLGTNALIQRWLPHRVLLLDDVSTALDLTNLSAECALLRKFAYTGDGERRRQVIVASHHDELTHRMFHLLLPPEGYSLLEIRLMEWSKDQGPRLEISRIRATGGANDETRGQLGGRLSQAWVRNPSRSSAS